MIGTFLFLIFFEITELRREVYVEPVEISPSRPTKVPFSMIGTFLFLIFFEITELRREVYVELVEISPSRSTKVPFDKIGFSGRCFKIIYVVAF